MLYTLNSHSAVCYYISVKLDTQTKEMQVMLNDPTGMQCARSRFWETTHFLQQINRKGMGDGEEEWSSSRRLWIKKVQETHQPTATYGTYLDPGSNKVLKM